MVPAVSAAFVGSHGEGNSTLVQLEPRWRGVARDPFPTSKDSISLCAPGRAPE